MAKIYVVTSGEYSDYKIEVIYSTREMAEEYANKHNKLKKYGSADEVTEFELDTPIEKHEFIYIIMDKQGNTYSIEREFNRKEGFGSANETVFSWTVQTTDEKRAIKVVNEKRIQILAAGIWGDYKAIEALFRRD